MCPHALDRGSAGGYIHDGRSDGGQKHGEGYGVGRLGHTIQYEQSGSPSRNPPGGLQRGEGAEDTTNGADTGVVARGGRAEFERKADGNGGVKIQIDGDGGLGDNSRTGIR